MTDVQTIEVQITGVRMTGVQMTDIQVAIEGMAADMAARVVIAVKDRKAPASTFPASMSLVQT